jgi:hypothetical protein
LNQIQKKIKSIYLDRRNQDGGISIVEEGRTIGWVL